jgi:gluconolactonase
MTRVWFVLAVMASIVACGSPPSEEAAPAAGAPAAGVGRVVRLSPALDALVPPDAVIEKVASGFAFTEGPLWRPDGRLWFSDVVGNVLRSVTPEGQVEVLMTDAAGVSTAPPGSYIGPNGMVHDRDGSVLMTQHFNRQIVRIGPDLQTSVFVDRFDGKRFNSPNDLVFRSDGSLYFTDPPFGLVQQDADPAKELDFNGVFRHADGNVQLLVRDLGRPNGIAFSPDYRTLYVSNTEDDRKVYMQYDVADDGSVSNGRVFADATADPAPGGPDGIKVDVQGNVYATGPGGVRVYAPDGTHLGTIATPEPAANCGWGDDGRTLYITAVTSIYRIRLAVEGMDTGA